MAQQDTRGRITAGAVTIAGLAAVWLAILTSLPSQEELSATVPAASAPVAKGIDGERTAVKPIAEEPVLDLSIPGVPQGSSVSPSASTEGNERPPASPSRPAAIDFRTAQVLRVKCEAEMEQLCPDRPDGAGRARCLERRVRELPPVCQDQVRERFVKWKEDRGRMWASCQDDVRRLCPTMKPGDGRLWQCLQDHAQEVTDRCYETLPKGRLLFRQ